MNYEKEKKENYTVYSISGNLDIYSINDLKKELLKSIDEEKIERLVFNMKKVQHMDSSGIGFLAFFYKKMKTNDGKFILTEIAPHVMAILNMASLDSYFEIKKSENEII